MSVLDSTGAPARGARGAAHRFGRSDGPAGTLTIPGTHPRWRWRRAAREKTARSSPSFRTRTRTNEKSLTRRRATRARLTGRRLRWRAGRVRVGSGRFRAPPDPHPHPHPHPGGEEEAGTAGRGLVKPPAWRARPRVSPPVAPPPPPRVRSPRARNRPGTRVEGDAQSLAPDVLDPSDGNLFGRDAMERPSGRTFPGTVREDSVCFGQTEAMRLLRLEERAPLAGDGVRAAPARRRGTGLAVADGGSGAFRGAERAAAAAIFRGDFDVAADLLAAADGPIPADFLARRRRRRRLTSSTDRRIDPRRGANTNARPSYVVRARRSRSDRVVTGGGCSATPPRSPPRVSSRRSRRARGSKGTRCRGGKSRRRGSRREGTPASGRPAAAVRALTRPGLGGARGGGGGARHGVQGSWRSTRCCERRERRARRGCPTTSGALRRWKKGGGGGEEEDFLEVWAEVKTRRAMESASGGADASGDRDI